MVGNAGYSTGTIIEPSGIADARPAAEFACLTYHFVGDQHNQYTLSEHQVEAQLKFLSDAGYVGEDFEDLEMRLASRQCFPARYVVLTCDDGHASVRRLADICESWGIRATFFVVRDYARGKANYIRECDIREIRGRGFSFGSHSASHRKLTFMSQQECREDLRISKEWLEDVLGEEVRWMAAPGGYINGTVQRLAEETGYTLCGTCREWMNSTHALTLPGQVNRTNVRRHFSRAVFRRAVEGDRGFYLWRRTRAAALVIPKMLVR